MSGRREDEDDGVPAAQRGLSSALTTEETLRDPRDLAIGHRAIQRGYLDRKQAFSCLEEAERRVLPLLEVARERGLLSPRQAEELAASSEILETRQGSQRLKAPPERAQLPAPGDRIGGYQVIRELGRGAMGVVYEARRGDRRFALKLLSADFETHPDLALRFEREAQSLAAVDQHPNVVRIYSFQREPKPFFALEFIEGESLAEQLEREGALPLDRALEIAVQLARALAHVHRAGIIHRDLKPGNVLLRREDDAPLLSDFGLMRRADLESLTQAGDMVGTPAYMAPEQIRADKASLSPATDLWALGALLYRMTTGRLPFAEPSLIALARKILHESPAPPSSLNPSLPRSLDALIERAMKKKAAERSTSLDAFAEACEALRFEDAIPAQPTKRYPRSRLAFGLVLAGLSLIGGFTMIERRRAATEQAQFDGARSLWGRALLDLERDRLALLGGALLAFASDDQSARELCVERSRELRDSAALLDDLHARLGRSEQASAGAARSQRAVELSQLRRRSRVWLSFGLAPGLVVGLRDDGYLALSRQLREGQHEALLGATSEALHAGGDALVAYARVAALTRAGRHRHALEELSELPAIDGLRDDVARLAQRCLSLDLVDGLFDPKRGRGSLKRGLSKLSDASVGGEDQGACWRRLEAQTKEAFEAHADNPAARGMAFARLHELQASEPQLPLPPENVALHVEAARHQLAQDREADAFMHYLAAQRLDPRFELPVSFSTQELITRMFNSGQERLVKLFELVVVATRAGFKYPFISDSWLERLERDQVLTKALKERPGDPTLCWFRGQLWPTDGLDKQKPERYRRALEANIRDLNVVVAAAKFNPSLRAKALTLRIDFKLSLARSAPLTDSERAACFDDLERAERLPHPQPDEIGLLRFDLLRGALPATEPLDLLEELSRSMALLEDRYQRYTEGRLGDGRLPNQELDPLPLMDYKTRRVRRLIRRSILLRQLDRPIEALSAAKECLKLRTGPLEVEEAALCLLACQRYDELRALTERYPRALANPLIKSALERGAGDR
jgi:predicted Ser/Thr protein kinase